MYCGNLPQHSAIAKLSNKVVPGQRLLDGSRRKNTQTARPPGKRGGRAGSHAKATQGRLAVVPIPRESYARALSRGNHAFEALSLCLCENIDFSGFEGCGATVPLSLRNCAIFGEILTRNLRIGLISRPLRRFFTRRHRDTGTAAQNRVQNRAKSDDLPQIRENPR